jgi:hypothetical protein
MKGPRFNFKTHPCRNCPNKAMGLSELCNNCKVDGIKARERRRGLIANKKRGGVKREK